MNGPRVLLVDDEPDFLRLIQDVLKEEGFLVFTARDGLQALKAARDSHPEVILLDWNLPGQDGLSVCKALKADPATRDIPVLMLTVRDRETDMVVGLEMGADDYVVKSALRPRVLVARVRAALRRRSAPEAEGCLTWGKFSLNLSRRELLIDGEPVELRLKEFELLAAFLRNPGRVLSRAQLTEAAWGVEYVVTSNTLNTTMNRLRSKLGREGARLQAVKGIGYRFDDDRTSPRP
jgi:two-component system phosphate regulon response regulator PhoB